LLLLPGGRNLASIATLVKKRLTAAQRSVNIPIVTYRASLFETTAGCDEYVHAVADELHPDPDDYPCQPVFFGGVGVDCRPVVVYDKIGYLRRGGGGAVVATAAAAADVSAALCEDATQFVLLYMLPTSRQAYRTTGFRYFCTSDPLPASAAPFGRILAVAAEISVGLMWATLNVRALLYGPFLFALQIPKLAAGVFVAATVAETVVAVELCQTRDHLYDIARTRRIGSVIDTLASLFSASVAVNYIGRLRRVSVVRHDVAMLVVVDAWYSTRMILPLTFHLLYDRFIADVVAPRYADDSSLDYGIAVYPRAVVNEMTVGELVTRPDPTKSLVLAVFVDYVANLSETLRHCRDAFRRCQDSLGVFKFNTYNMATLSVDFVAAHNTDTGSDEVEDAYLAIYAAVPTADELTERLGAYNAKIIAERSVAYAGSLAALVEGLVTRKIKKYGDLLTVVPIPSPLTRDVATRSSSSTSSSSVHSGWTNRQYYPIVLARAIHLACSLARVNFQSLEQTYNALLVTLAARRIYLGSGPPNRNAPFPVLDVTLVKCCLDVVGPLRALERLDMTRTQRAATEMKDTRGTMTARVVLSPDGVARLYRSYAEAMVEQGDSTLISFERHDRQKQFNVRVYGIVDDVAKLMTETYYTNGPAAAIAAARTRLARASDRLTTVARLVSAGAAPPMDTVVKSLAMTAAANVGIERALLDTLRTPETVAAVYGLGAILPTVSVIDLGAYSRRLMFDLDFKPPDGMRGRADGRTWFSDSTPAGQRLGFCQLLVFILDFTALVAGTFEYVTRANDGSPGPRSRLAVRAYVSVEQTCPVKKTPASSSSSSSSRSLFWGGGGGSGGGCGDGIDLAMYDDDDDGVGDDYIADDDQEYDMDDNDDDGDNNYGPDDDNNNNNLLDDDDDDHDMTTTTTTTSDDDTAPAGAPAEDSGPLPLDTVVDAQSFFSPDAYAELRERLVNSAETGLGQVRDSEVLNFCRRSYTTARAGMQTSKIGVRLIYTDELTGFGSSAAREAFVKFVMRSADNNTPVTEFIDRWSNRSRAIDMSIYTPGHGCRLPLNSKLASDGQFDRQLVPFLLSAAQLEDPALYDPFAVDHTRLGYDPPPTQLLRVKTDRVVVESTRPPDCETFSIANTVDRRGVHDNNHHRVDDPLTSTSACVSAYRPGAIETAVGSGSGSIARGRRERALAPRQQFVDYVLVGSDFPVPSMTNDACSGAVDHTSDLARLALELTTNLALHRSLVALFQKRIVLALAPMLRPYFADVDYEVDEFSDQFATLTGFIVRDGSRQFGYCVRKAIREPYGDGATNGNPQYIVRIVARRNPGAVVTDTWASKETLYESFGLTISYAVHCFTDNCKNNSAQLLGVPFNFRYAAQYKQWLGTV